MLRLLQSRYGKRLAFFTGLASVVLCVAFVSFITRSHCEYLRVSRPLTTVHTLGTISFDAFTNDTIWLSAKAGNLMDDQLYDRRTDNLNYDGLYQLTRDGKRWLFRHGGQAFNSDGSKRTLLYDVQWNHHKFPEAAGDYEVAVMAETLPPPPHSTLNTVGDSITWWQHGEHFRCRLADAGLELRFVGSRTDSFGYGHDGEGGNTTRDVLKRINHIAPSAHYFLLIGTNDRFRTDETIKNIIRIAHRLNAKQNSTVFISTLLPRTDEFNARNETVNVGLKQALASCTHCKNMVLIDTNAAFQSHPEWPSLLADGLHPNEEGYAFLAKYVAESISKLQNVELAK